MLIDKWSNGLPNEWIDGLPSEELLEANQSRLWLEKQDNHLTHKIVQLLPKEERRQVSKERYFLQQIIENLYTDPLDRSSHYTYMLVVDESLCFKVENTTEKVIVLTGKINLNYPTILSDLLPLEKEGGNCFLDLEIRYKIIDEIRKMAVKVKNKNNFRITLEQEHAILHHLKYCPIDLDGNKLINYNYPAKQATYPLPTNFTWWPQGAFHFEHDKMIVTFNVFTGELGICYVITGVEPEFVWKFNKPIGKPTHFAKLEEKIYL